MEMEMVSDGGRLPFRTLRPSADDVVQVRDAARKRFQTTPYGVVRTGENDHCGVRTSRCCVVDPVHIRTSSTCMPK